MLQLVPITTNGPELQTVVNLFKEYAAELNEDLCFQSFHEELMNPLKKYGPPKGSLLLAYYQHQAVGCVALTDISNSNTSHTPGGNALTTLSTCEMKRLYVKPAFRQYKVGQALVEAILTEAKKWNYQMMKLDTLEKLQPAIRLYLKQGFSITNAYYANPLPGVVYMEKLLLPNSNIQSIQ
jgi:putative acetyltransferase